MHYTEPYKLQLNLEISSSNMLEILKQLARLSKDSNINTSFALPEAIPDISSEPLETRIVSLIHEIGIPSHIMGVSVSERCRTDYDARQRYTQCDHKSIISGSCHKKQNNFKPSGACHTPCN